MFSHFINTWVIFWDELIRPTDPANQCTLLHITRVGDSIEVHLKILVFTVKIVPADPAPKSPVGLTHGPLRYPKVCRLGGRI